MLIMKVIMQEGGESVAVYPHGPRDIQRSVFRPGDLCEDPTFVCLLWVT